MLRGDTPVAVIAGAGSIFGEMSVLLNRPAHRDGRAATPVGVFVFDDAENFLKSHPEIAFFLGRLLAERLNAATTYLVDLKRQFEGHGNHLGMVGEVLETLIHQQHEEFTSGPERGRSAALSQSGFPSSRGTGRSSGSSSGRTDCPPRKTTAPRRLGVDDDVRRRGAELLPGIEHPGRPDAVDP